jgi:LPXTG-motif cell wall-anchored protein
VFKVVGILICSLFVTEAALAHDWPTWRHRGPVSAPEIDPASALSGLTLLVGGLAVVRGRRKK